MLSDVLDQPWNITIVTPQKSVSHLWVTLQPRSQEHSKGSGKLGEVKLLREFQGTWLNFIWKNIKNLWCSVFLWLRSRCMERRKLLLFVHPTGRLCTLKQREQITVWDVLYCLARDQIAKIKGTKLGDIQTWVYHLLHLWLWASY